MNKAICLMAMILASPYDILHADDLSHGITSNKYLIIAVQYDYCAASNIPLIIAADEDVKVASNGVICINKKTNEYFKINYTSFVTSIGATNLFDMGSNDTYFYKIAFTTNLLEMGFITMDVSREERTPVTAKPVIIEESCPVVLDIGMSPFKPEKTSDGSWTKELYIVAREYPNCFSNKPDHYKFLINDQATNGIDIKRIRKAEWITHENKTVNIHESVDKIFPPTDKKTE